MENTDSTLPQPVSTVVKKEVDTQELQRIADRMGLAYFEPNRMKGLRELGEAVMEVDPKMLSLGTLVFSQQDLVRSASELREYLREAEDVEQKLAIHKTLVVVHHEIAANIKESRELADSISQGRARRQPDRGGACFKPGQKVEATQIIINQRINEQSAGTNEPVPPLLVPNGGATGTRPTHSTVVECGTVSGDGLERAESIPDQPA